MPFAPTEIWNVNTSISTHSVGSSAFHTGIKELIGLHLVALVTQVTEP